MGLFYPIFWLLRMFFGTLYPTYLSYKAIKINDLASLETLLMYWVVMAVVSAIEGTVEWVVNWFPFYYEAKTLVIIWLTLPQIQGSTFVYVTYIHPFLLEHEQDIDATMVEAKEKAKEAGLDYLRQAMERIREFVLGTIAPSMLAAEPSQAGGPAQPLPTPAPTTANGYAINLLRQYGPAAFAATNALFHPMQTRGGRDNLAPQPDASASPGSPAMSARSAAGTQNQISDFITREQMRRRRVELERELASLESPPLDRGPGPAIAQGLGGPRAPSRPLRDLTDSPVLRTSAPLPPQGLSRMRDPVGARVERSLHGSQSGFEEIASDEASGSEGEWARNIAAAADRAGDSDRRSASGSRVRGDVAGAGAGGPGGEVPKAWWWGWGGRPLEELEEERPKTE